MPTYRTGIGATLYACFTKERKGTFIDLMLDNGF
jgi:hypothetical protein